MGDNALTSENAFPQQLTCAFPTNNRPQPTATGHPSEQFAFPTSPYDAEPDPSTRVATMVEVACQLNSVLNSPAEFRVPSRRCPQFQRYAPGVSGNPRLAYPGARLLSDEASTPVAMSW